MAAESRLFRYGALLSLMWALSSAHAVEFVGHMNLVEEPGLTIMAPARDMQNWCQNYGYGKGIVRIAAVYDVPHEDRLVRLGSYEDFVRNRALPLIRSNCDTAFDTVWLMLLRDTDHVNGRPKLFDILVFELSGNEPSYIEYRAIASRQAWTDEQRAAMAPSVSMTQPDRLAAIFEDDNISVYPREPTWCRELRGATPKRGGGLNLVYKVPHDERDEMFYSEYRDLGTTVIEPLVKAQKCHPSASVNVYMFREGESEHWNALRFGQVELSGVSRRTGFGVRERIPGPGLQARIDKFEKDAARRAWGTNECEGPLCDLSGGVYLQAIYDADVAALRRFDANVDDHVQRRYVNAFKSLTESLTGEQPRAHFSLLIALADTYLYGYQSGYADACPDDLINVESRLRLETYDLYNNYGMYMGQGGGEVFTANYRIKPELMPLCEKICDHFGGQTNRWVVNGLDYSSAKLTMAGLTELTEKFACDDPHVLRFERNLAMLTETYLDDRRAWVDAPAR